MKQYDYKNVHLLKVIGMTDIGKARSLNEDSFYVDEELGLLIVADGMGGHAAGNVASAEAVVALRHYLRVALMSETSGANLESILEQSIPGFKKSTLPEHHTDHALDQDRTLDDIPMMAVLQLRNAVAYANAKIHQMNIERGYGQGRGMGTTIVGLWYAKSADAYLMFHIGDSRLYRLRKQHLEQLTHDHSLYQAWKDAGGTGDAPRRNIILRALGPSVDVELDTAIIEIQPDDVVLLCSDGLNGMLEDHEIEAVLRQARQANLGLVCEKLIEYANARGGKDNISVILGYCQTPAEK